MHASIYNMSGQNFLVTAVNINRGTLQTLVPKTTTHLEFEIKTEAFSGGAVQAIPFPEHFLLRLIH